MNFRIGIAIENQDPIKVDSNPDFGAVKRGIVCTRLDASPVHEWSFRALRTQRIVTEGHYTRKEENSSFKIWVYRRLEYDLDFESRIDNCVSGIFQSRVAKVLLEAGHIQDFVIKESFDPLSCGIFEISLDKYLRFPYIKLRKVRGGCESD